MEKLKITLVQPYIIWEDKTANLEKYSKMVLAAGETDLIVLPEMFTTGFSMQSEKLKETMEGPGVHWMKEIAALKNASVVGSLIIEENGKIYNRAVWVFPDDKTEYYDKRHLFTMGQEKNHYSKGLLKTVVEFRGWKFCPLICYDLRFPVWSRNTENYDVLIYVANWPAPRHQVWKNLLVARAIENQSYCVGVNRVGTDGAGLSYLGGSAMINARGEAGFFGKTEEVRTFEISYSKLQNFRKSFPLLEDKDEFSIHVY
jgi:predicted amidohydrolase